MLMARSEYHRVFLLSPANSDAFANCVQSERPDFVLCGLYGGGNADRDDRRPRKARRSRKRERRSNNAGGPERGRLRGPVTEARTWRRACFTPLLLGALNPHWRPVFASAVWTGLRRRNSGRRAFAGVLSLSVLQFHLRDDPPWLRVSRGPRRPGA